MKAKSVALKSAEGRAMHAALRWWRARRPRGWNVRDHLVHPTVNTTSASDRYLAQSAARVVRAILRERGVDL